MLRTPVCELLAIETPIVQAGMGPWATADLAAAVSKAGGLGTVGAGTRTPTELQCQITRLRARTDRPFAINHTLSNFDQAGFEVTLNAGPRLVSFALGDPGELVKRVHEIGSLVMLQVTTVEQARLAAERNVDLVVAQGGEAGGFGGHLGTLALVPQVVDAVTPIPVLAAGGIADGRGLAAALCLGAQGINVGTRFLASAEAPISAEWQRAILAAASHDTIKVGALDRILPGLSGEFGAVPRALRSDYVHRLNSSPSHANASAARLKEEVIAALHDHRLYDLLPFAGETVGLIDEILPDGEIVARLTAEAAAVLRPLARNCV